MSTCSLAHVSEDRPTHVGRSLWTWACSAVRGGRAPPLPSTPPTPKPSVGEFRVQGPASLGLYHSQCLNIYCPTSPGGTVPRKALACLLTLASTFGQRDGSPAHRDAKSDKVLEEPVGRSHPVDLPDHYPGPLCSSGCSGGTGPRRTQYMWFYKTSMLLVVRTSS